MEAGGLLSQITSVETNGPFLEQFESEMRGRLSERRAEILHKVQGVVRYIETR